jgi:hypothetical protein
MDQVGGHDLYRSVSSQISWRHATCLRRRNPIAEPTALGKALAMAAQAVPDPLLDHARTLIHVPVRKLEDDIRYKIVAAPVP